MGIRTLFAVAAIASVPAAWGQTEHTMILGTVTDASGSVIGGWQTIRQLRTQHPDCAGPNEVDFSLFKNFRITESKNVQFRWELYNATNTPPFNPPNRSIGTGTFGQINSAGLAREMQFDLRLEF